MSRENHTATNSDKRKRLEEEQRASDKRDVLNKYETVLEGIYQDRTAGDWTFLGVLTEFIREWEALLHN